MPHAGGPEPECKGHFIGPRRRTRQAPGGGTDIACRPEGVEVMTALDERALTSSSIAVTPAADVAQSIELRHLRYFVALADAGSFTQAAERIFIAQPTLSQQIRRLEQIVGTPLLPRRREGLRLTTAGRVLLDGSRNVLALVDQEVGRTRQAAGLGRPQLRVVMPPGLPESLAVPATAGLQKAARS